MMYKQGVMILMAGLALSGCVGLRRGSRSATFGNDIAFMKRHVDVLVLSDASGTAQVAVVPQYQGRVMTSTSGGMGGQSYGWINRDLIASRTPVAQVNAYGGEDRFWIGPEGGQFSVYFKNGVPFVYDNWQVPAAVDTTPFDLVSHDGSRAVFQREFRLENYMGTVFLARVDRDISILDAAGVSAALGVERLSGIECVGFESRNTLTNAGRIPWQAESGLLSIWILGMLNASDFSTVVIPYVVGDEAALGPIVNDTYFGKVPNSRLKVADGVLFFKADGCYRSKIGLSPQRALSRLGSYDAKHGVLTVVQYNKPSGADTYVNSTWKIQEHPYRGDVINAYNSAPQDGFYELESSSPAAALGVGGRITHIHRTIHLKGSEADLDPISRRLFGVGIAEIREGMAVMPKEGCED